MISDGTPGEPRRSGTNRARWLIPALLIVGWLAEERNARWLDFGSGRRSVDTLGLKVMTQRNLHCLRVYTPDDEDRAVGIVGLSNVDTEFATAEMWFVLGEKAWGPADLTIRAAALMLEHGFRELGLASVFAWTVESNRRGRRVLERLHFTCVGRRRCCHRIDGKLHDRLFFDLLAEEFRGVEGVRARSGAVTSPAALAREER